MGSVKDNFVVSMAIRTGVIEHQNIRFLSKPNSVLCGHNIISDAQVMRMKSNFSSAHSKFESR